MLTDGCVSFSWCRRRRRLRPIGHVDVCLQGLDALSQFLHLLPQSRHGVGSFPASFPVRFGKPLFDFLFGLAGCAQAVQGFLTVILVVRFEFERKERKKAKAYHKYENTKRTRLLASLWSWFLSNKQKHVRTRKKFGTIQKVTTNKSTNTMDRERLERPG